MKTVKKYKTRLNKTTWEEKSGFLEFLSSVPAQVTRFNDSFGFDIHNLIVHPTDIDGDSEMAMKLAFVLERHNPLLPELTYCLYAVLQREQLIGYVGICNQSSITTLRELKPITDFKAGHAVLHEWLGQLVKASCEKIMP